MPVPMMAAECRPKPEAQETAAERGLLLWFPFDAVILRTAPEQTGHVKYCT